MEPSVKFCPICRHENAIEAKKCVKCGASLDEKKYITIKTPSVQISYSDKPKDLTVDEAIIPREGIVVYFAESTKPHVVRTDPEFVIGRTLIPTSEPMLDLSDFDGFKLGLSRRHAMIRKTTTEYEIIDLASTNGTWLNEEKLTPYAPYPLPSGSRLFLSRIRLFVFYRAVKEE
ncbi:MAG TPA: FHA domain-containing protein [Anaerolineales bacterium]